MATYAKFEVPADEGGSQDSPFSHGIPIPARNTDSLLMTTRKPSKIERQIRATIRRCKVCKVDYDKAELHNGFCRHCADECNQPHPMNATPDQYQVVVSYWAL